MWRSVADAPDKPVYLITGSDGPKVETAIARLRSHFEVESIETVTALDTSGETVVGLCNAGSLFGDARLIVVTDVDGVKADRGRRGGWKAADAEAIAGYLSSPAPDNGSHARRRGAQVELRALEGMREGGRVLALRRREEESCRSGSPTSSSSAARAPSRMPSPPSSSSSATISAR